MEAEKLVWEFFNNEKQGWVVLAKENIDDNNQLKGIALDLKNEGVFKFRQTPASEIGKGDSRGECKAIIELSLD